MTAVPYAEESERAVLAAAMVNPQALVRASSVLSVDDFYPEQHREIWTVMCGLQSAGVPVEPSVVLLEALKVRPALAEVITRLDRSAVSVNLGYHLERIEQAAIARELQTVTAYAAQEAESASFLDPELDPVLLAERAIERLRGVQRMRQPAESSTVDVLDLIDRVMAKEDMIIEGLLARGERMIITAPEGYGKTELLRQIGGCVAGGLHPFKPMGVQPRKVWHVDAENPESVSVQAYGGLIDYLEALGHCPRPGMLMVEQMGSTNVLDPRTAAYLLNLADAIKPDLILIGPIYALHEENPNDEGPARKVAAFLTRLRDVNRSAMIIEAHTPHSDGPSGQMRRPFGASLWKRWPEFGYFLGPDMDSMGGNDAESRRIAELMRQSIFVPWRGNRAKGREWPRRLEAGSRLPWQVSP